MLNFFRGSVATGGASVTRTGCAPASVGDMKGRSGPIRGWLGAAKQGVLTIRSMNCGKGSTNSGAASHASEAALRI